MGRADAVFIFHREEDETLGCTGPLAGDDTARHFHKLTIPAAATLAFSAQLLIDSSDSFHAHSVTWNAPPFFY